MGLYRVFSSPVQLEVPPVDGRHYSVQSGGLVEDAAGFEFYQAASQCPSDRPAITIQDSRLHWSLPDAYLQAAPLEGRPFVHGVLDCYVALRDYYQRTYAIELPALEYEDEWWHFGKNYYLETCVSAGFEAVPMTELRPGDVLAMRVHAPVVNHTAVYIGDGKIYHHMGGRVSCIEALRPAHMRWVDSIWRHKDVA